MRTHRVIQLHAAAPAKPGMGEPCNGCGVCCASEPCPLGMLASRRRQGRCAKLVWNDDAGVYRCGLIEAPAAPLLARLARRFISAGSGCDCDLEAETNPNPQTAQRQ